MCLWPGPVTLNRNYRIGSDARVVDRSGVGIIRRERELRAQLQICEKYEGASGIFALPLERAVRLRSMLIDPCPT